MQVTQNTINTDSQASSNDLNYISIVWAFIINYLAFELYFPTPVDVIFTPLFFVKVITIILTIILHEAGILIGMHFLSHNNPRLLIVPSFSKFIKSPYVLTNEYKDCGVLFLSVLPNIIIPIIVAYVFRMMNIQSLQIYTFTFLAIVGTAFLLLIPLTPLSGGRLANMILRRTNIYVEIFIRFLFALIILMIGFGKAEHFSLAALFFTAISVYSIISSFKNERIANKLKIEAFPQDLHGVNDFINNYTDNEKENYFQSQIQHINEEIIKTPSHHNILSIIRNNPLEKMVDIWQRITYRRISVGKTFGVLGFLILTIITIFICSFVTLNVYNGVNFTESEDSTLEEDAKILATQNNISQEPIDFTLNDLDGEPFKLSETKGKKVVINFWATWCPPCKKELPGIQKLAVEIRE